MDPDTAERGRQALVQVVEAEYEALGGNNNVQVISTIEAYLRLPLKEFRCLRFFILKHYMVCE